MYTCCVPGCGTRNCGTSVKFHSFPVKLEVFNTWVERIGNPKLLQGDHRRIRRSFRVCHDHFSEHARIPAPYRSRTGLVRYPLPTLNLPNFNEPSTPENSMFLEPYVTHPIPAVQKKKENEVIDLDIKEEHSYVRISSLIEKPKLTFVDEVITESFITTSDNLDDLHLEDKQNEIEDTYNTNENINYIETIHQDQYTETQLQQSFEDNINAQSSEPKSQSKIHFDKKNRVTLSKAYHTYLKMIKIARKLNLEATVVEKVKIFKRIINLHLYLQKKYKVTFNFLHSLRPIRNKIFNGNKFSRQAMKRALTISKMSCKDYRLLQKPLGLPAKNTEKDVMKKITLLCGVNGIIMNVLKLTVEQLNKEDRFCVLLFGEMPLKPRLSYNKVRDVIEGFEDLGTWSSKHRFADCVTVFMIRGIRKEWKHPLCYYFSKGRLKEKLLIRAIKEVITAVQNTGLKIIAAICKQTPHNMLIYELLKSESVKPNEQGQENHSFIVNKQEILPLFDSPDLLRCIRNLLLVKHAIFQYKSDDIQIASWKDIEIFYGMEQAVEEDSRTCSHLTDAHIYRDKIDKDAITPVTEVFSHRLGSVMHMLRRLDNNQTISMNLNNTGRFLMFFDELFDSVNGSAVEINQNKKLRYALKANSPHHQFWENALNVLQSIKFISANGIAYTPRAIKNWISNLQSIKQLWKQLQMKGIKTLFLRNLNLDPLENVFDYIRSQSKNKVNLNCTTFSRFVKGVMINQPKIYHKSEFNRQKDKCKSLLELLPVFTLIRKFSNYNKAQGNDADLTNKKLYGTYLYISRFAAKRILRKIGGCNTCKQHLLGASAGSQDLKLYGPKVLSRPTTNFFRAFTEICDIYCTILPHICKNRKIKKHLQKVAVESETIFLESCEKHNLRNIVIYISTDVFLSNWMKNINNTLKGVDIYRYTQFKDPVRKMAQKVAKDRHKRAVLKTIRQSNN